LDVSFAPESDLPAVRAAVDVLLLIGRALRNHFFPLLRAQEAKPPTWDDVLGTMAEILFREMRAKHITHINHALDVWREFEASRTVRLLGNSGAKAIRDVGLEIATNAVPGNAGIGLEILWDANLRAARWIERAILPHLPDLAFAIAPIVIDFDEPGSQFCASSSPLLWEIHWTLQPVPHSLFGAMVVPRILQHEYVCHLMPRNHHLSSGVREVFLVEGMREESRNDPRLNPRDRESDEKLEGWFRILLQQHSYRLGLSSRAETRNFESVALLVRRKSQADFWKMTAEIVAGPGSAPEAAVIDRVLKILRSAPDAVLDRLAIPWTSFPECLESSRRLRRI
jgi:hypothetical protein